MKTHPYLRLLTGCFCLISSGMFSQALFTEQIILEDFQGATCIAAADFDADGDMDLVATANTGHKVSWFEQTANFQFTEHIVVTGFSKAKGVITARIDSNDSWDIVATAKTLGRFSWFSNDGSGNFTEHIITDSTWTSADYVYADDIDEDTDNDLVLVACDNHKIAWAENDGEGNFTVHLIRENWTKVNWATVMDLDGDSDRDVVACAKEGQVLWFKNDGQENFTEQPLVTGLPGANSVQVADLDADDDFDLVVTACDNTDQVAWYENDGSFTYTEHLLKGQYNGARASKIADLDQDGDTDILSIAWQTGIVNFWENNGEGIFSERVVSEDAYDMIQVYITDMDLDGDEDILGACFGSHELRWWESINTFLIPGYKATPQTGQKPLEVQFTDQTYAKPLIHTWQWDFNNDGIVDSQEQNPVYTFPETGNYTVKLVVDNDSLTDSIVRQQDIRVFDGESSLEFNGSDSRTRCLNDPPLNLTGNFTIETWIKPVGFGSSGAGKIFDKAMIAIYVNQDLPTMPVDSSFVVMMVHEGGILSTFTTATGTAEMNTWQHLALTYDSVSSEAHIYLNGIDQPLQLVTPPVGPVAANSTREIVLGNAKTGNLAFQGCIDEVRIWSSIRSETEIEEWMEKNLPDTQPGLFGYWKFDEGRGDTAFDRSGSGYHGILSQVQWGQGVELTSIGIRDFFNCDSRDFRLTVYPDPLTSSSRIILKTPHAGIYQAMLLTSSGREVENGLTAFTLTAGNHEISWNDCIAPGVNDLLPGLYLLCFQSGNSRECCKVIVP